MIFLLKFGFYSLWAKCVEFPLPTVLLVDSQPRRAHYFAKQSIVCYTLLNSRLFCSAFVSKVFLYDIHWKTLLKIHFQLVSNFIFLPPSFCFTFSFCSYESTKDKLSLYLYWKVSISLRGCFAKVFYPLTIIGKLRAVCWGISRKFLYFFFRNIENLIPPQKKA